MRQGTVFTSKSDAQAAFKKNYGSQYGSKYGTEPKTRPTHIPQSTTVDGKTVNINYNPQYGGYGYTNGLGTFILYDALSDAAMMSMLMSNHNYVTHAPVVTGTTTHTVVHISNGFFTFLSVVFWILLVFIIIIIIVNHLD